MTTQILKPLQMSATATGDGAFSSQACLLHENCAAELLRRTARMVHELRNPLHGILGAAAILRGPASATVGSDPERMLQIIETSGKHMMKLVSQMTEVALSKHGHLPMQPRKVNLRRIMRESLDIVEPMAASKGLLPRLDVDHSVPDEVTVDPTRVQQVMVNLLGNAIRFTDAGLVEVSVRQCSAQTTVRDPARRTLRFDVRDTGIGMAEGELLDLLTEVRGGAESVAPRSVRRGGSGLGLLVCERILGAMNSTLNVVSSPGAGTRVWFAIQI